MCANESPDSTASITLSQCEACERHILDSAITDPYVVPLLAPEGVRWQTSDRFYKLDTRLQSNGLFTLESEPEICITIKL